MFIAPIQFGNFSTTQLSQTAIAQDNSFFKEMTTLINETKQAEQQAAQDAYNLAAGKADNLHEITINATKAEVSLQLMVQVRNKLLDSYKEIMQMGI